MKKLVIKSIVKFGIFYSIFAIIGFFLDGAVLTNEVAMGQMELDNVSYMAWEGYNALKQIVKVVEAAGSVILGYTIYKDFEKHNNQNNELKELIENV